jgi:hypothetical protein
MYGSQVNITSDFHLTVLLKNKLNFTNILTSKNNGLTTSEQVQLEKCNQIISAVYEIIPIGDKQHTITILGFTAGGGLAKTLLTLSFSGLFAAFKLFN